MRPIVLSIALLLGTALAAQNAYLTNAFVPRFWKAGTDWTVSARVRNSVADPLISFHVDWRWNNGAVQVGNWQSTTGISGNQYWPYVHQIAFNQPESAGTLKVWVVGAGDTDATNDTLYFPVGVINNWTEKSVLMEQYTGTWCQFCPNPNETTNALDADPFIVVAKHHNNDEFTSASSTAYWAQFSANYSPAGVMEQEEFGTLQDDAAYDLWSARAELRKQGVSPAIIDIDAAFNDWTRLLTVDVTTTTTAAITGDLVLNAYVLEDNVPGPQTSASPGYIHHQLVREVLGGASGTSGVFPATTSAGSLYTHQYTLTVPEQWNSNNLRVIAMVTERRNGTSFTVNVADADLVAVGVEERSQAPVLNVFPNPTSGDLFITLTGSTGQVHVQVLTIDGRCVIDQRENSIGSALRVDGFASLAAGTYLVRVQQNGLVSERRVVR